MAQLLKVTGKELIQFLSKHGFSVARMKGNDHFLRYPDGRRTVIPVHSGETLGLVRIFHTDLLQKPGLMMHTSLDSHFDLGSMKKDSPASQCSSPLSHQTSLLPRHDQHEISGLGLFLKILFDVPLSEDHIA